MTFSASGSTELQPPEGWEPTWCERCQRFHSWTPPWQVTERLLIEELGQAMADEIDREVLQELLNAR